MKKFLFVILLIYCSGCANSNNNSTNNLPSWYVNPKANDISYLYGVGEGFTIQEASKSALNNLASKLAISVSSESSTLAQVDNYSVNQEFRQKILEKVEQVKFSNYQVSNSQNVGNNFYAEVKVDRSSFIQEQKRVLEQNHQKMAALEQSSKNQNILIRRNKLAEIQDLVTKSALINEILNGLNANENFTKNLAKYQYYQEAYDKILDKIEFFIKSDNQQIKDVLIKALNSENIKIGDSINNSNDLIVLEINHSAKSENIYNSQVTKINVNFKLRSTNNKILASNNIEASGAAIGDEKQAFNMAVKNLAKKIAEKGILTIIGIVVNENN